MSSRDEILKRLQQQQPAEIAAPAEFTAGITYEDPAAQFATALEAVGGRCESVASPDQATAILESIPEYAAAETICSLVPGIGRSTFDLSSITDPHDLQDVDFAILPGELAVAENGAVWVTTSDACHRIMHFLGQHLALVVPRNRILSNLHEAYSQIAVGSTPFATWISGPSKTADIEQSLVKGAHGARSLTVFLLDELHSGDSSL